MTEILNPMMARVAIANLEGRDSIISAPDAMMVFHYAVNMDDMRLWEIAFYACSTLIRKAA